MGKNKTILFFLLMHLGFFIYSLYSLTGKFLAREPFFTAKFFMLGFLVVCILFIYAVLWQQVLKHISLSAAVANKSVIILWGMFWGKLIFNEPVTLRMIIGSVIILAGILLLSGCEKNE